MLNRNYRKLNINELEKVAGGIRVLNETENNYSPDPSNMAGIPRGGKLQVRVK